MAQSHLKRETARALKHATRQGHFADGSLPAASVPRDVRALAREIEAAQYNCSPRSYRELERARAMLAKGMPSGALTNRDGFSERPVFAGEARKTDADFRGV